MNPSDDFYHDVGQIAVVLERRVAVYRDILTPVHMRDPEQTADVITWERTERIARGHYLKPQKEN